MSSETVQLWGNISVFAGHCKRKTTWTVHSKKTLTAMITESLLHATQWRGKKEITIPLVLKKIKFSKRDKDNTYNIRCLVEINKHLYLEEAKDLYDFTDFFLNNIPHFDFQVDDPTVTSEFWLDPNEYSENAVIK
jgi:hypothetical protein